MSDSLIGCSCHINPPCSFCASLTEGEAEAYSEGGLFGLDRYRDETRCGLCGEPGADKIPHPIYWPGEQKPDTDLVHSECESEECARAHAALSHAERDSFLRGIR